MAVVPMCQAKRFERAMRLKFQRLGFRVNATDSAAVEKVGQDDLQLGPTILLGNWLAR